MLPKGETILQQFLCTETSPMTKAKHTAHTKLLARRANKATRLSSYLQIIHIMLLFRRQLHKMHYSMKVKSPICPCEVMSDLVDSKVSLPTRVIKTNGQSKTFLALICYAHFDGRHYHLIIVSPITLYAYIFHGTKKFCCRQIARRSRVIFNELCV
jgi:hypothetical protein